KDGVVRSHGIGRHARDSGSHSTKIGEELHNFISVCIGHVDDVFMPHWESLHEEKARWVAEICTIDCWYQFLAGCKFAQINAHSLERFAELSTVQKHLCRICTGVEEAPRFGHSLIERQSFLLKSELPSQPAGLSNGTECADRNELLLLAVHVNRVSRRYKNVFPWVVDQCWEIY